MAEVSVNRVLDSAGGRASARPGRLVAVALATLLAVCAVVGVSWPMEAKMSSTLTSADNGRTVDLRVGDQVTLRLPENPSTGYRWAVDAADASLVEIQEGEYVATSK